MLDLARIACLAALIAAFAACVCAQEADTQTQIWPEVNVYVPIKPKIRLFFIAAITKLEETRDNTEGQVGAHVDFLLTKKFSLRAGYRYGLSLGGNDPFTEHR